ncbi:hypothetical protein BSKO_05247 [Bryopsis sp. KO-2023]|nr:hypothetical protein BSKO_05247 [Bryopsis sp. KO-2023]
MASKLTLIRRLAVQQARAQLYEVPSHQLVELPGRPNVVYELRDYSRDQQTGAEKARKELPFLFRPFEVGQRPPPREGSVEASIPRESTIHEYLDWTVTAKPVVREENLDFSGFRVICLLPRLRPNWPAPGAYENETPKACEELGGPKNPLPCLLTNGKPVCSATLRCGRGYLEIPFFATKESRRGQGFGRCLLEAIEGVARSVGVGKLLLCSTDDENTISTWKHLGFRETSAMELDAWGICSGDLLHMTNTVQMVKVLDDPKPWSSLIIRHKHFVQRTYYLGQPVESRIGWKRKFEEEERAFAEEAVGEAVGETGGQRSSKKACIERVEEGRNDCERSVPCGKMCHETEADDDINNSNNGLHDAAPPDRDLNAGEDCTEGAAGGDPWGDHCEAGAIAQCGVEASAANSPNDVEDKQRAEGVRPSKNCGEVQMPAQKNPAEQRVVTNTPDRHVVGGGGGDSEKVFENETNAWVGCKEGPNFSHRILERREGPDVAGSSTVRKTECKS